jgi:hypothetical protein
MQHDAVFPQPANDPYNLRADPARRLLSLQAT